MNVLKLLLILPLAVSSESNLPFCVLLIDAILELNEPILVDIEELKLPILELNPLVVVATDEDKEPMLFEILELNVEYPVVLVISICNEPETTPSLFNLLLIVVLIELVNEFKLDVVDSILFALEFIDVENVLYSFTNIILSSLPNGPAFQ